MEKLSSASQCSLRCAWPCHCGVSGSSCGVSVAWLDSIEFDKTSLSSSCFPSVVVSRDSSCRLDGGCPWLCPPNGMSSILAFFDGAEPAVSKSSNCRLTDRGNAVSSLESLPLDLVSFDEGKGLTAAIIMDPKWL
jgi:hypothetical protein